MRQKNEPRLARERLYWICQASGWALGTVFSLLLFSALDNVACRGVWIYAAVGYGAVGFACSHALRVAVRRFRWAELPPSRLLLRLIIAGMLLSTGLYAVVVEVVLRSVHIELFAGAARIVDFMVNWGGRMFVWILLYFGFHYIEEYRRNETEYWRLSAALKDAELLALKAQMNPHFLFNSLNNLEELILEDSARAREAVSKLSALLRYALQSGGAPTVTLEEELAVVRDYLDLEAIRFEKRLRTRFDIAPAALSGRVPPLLLQTLVENAVKHGVAKLPQGGEVSVSARNRGDRLVLTVSNDGRLEKRETKGVGLANTRERLRLIFGDEATFSISNGEGKRVSAEAIIPRLSAAKAAE